MVKNLLKNIKSKNKGETYKYDSRSFLDDRYENQDSMAKQRKGTVRVIINYRPLYLFFPKRKNCESQSTEFKRQN